MSGEGKQDFIYNFLPASFAKKTGNHIAPRMQKLELSVITFCHALENASYSTTSSVQVTTKLFGQEKHAQTK